MRNKRAHSRHAVVLILAVAVLITWAATSLASFRRASARRWRNTGSLNTGTLRANGKIAFTSDRDGNPEIYVMNADGTNQVRLTNNSVVDDSSTWSPDGTRIAFVSQKQNGSFAIYRMKADGSDRTEITALNDSNWARYRPLSWSPDGGKIAFHDYSAVSGSIDIFVVNVDGSVRQNLTSDHADGDLTPVWSPDGSKILFSRNDLYEVYGGTMLHTINSDGTNLTRLLNGFADGWNEDFADWSLAANKIVYSVNRWDFVLDLYIANPDGTGRQFFHGCDWTDPSCRSHALTPAFSPDGTKIAFSIAGFVNPQKLYVKSLDGTGLTLLTDNGESPSWQPLAPATNPIDSADFFVRQHYLDFLAREPEPSGLAAWLKVLNSCSVGDLICQHEQRLTTSAAFFGSPEFRLKGYFVFRFYRAAFARLPDYSEISADMRSVTSQTTEDVYARKSAFTDSFVQRSEFVTLFNGLPNADYVEALLSRYNLTSISTPDPAQPDSIVKVTLTQSQLVSQLDAGTLTRAQVLRAIADSDQVLQAEFNRAFVAMQYYGYLRRTPEPTGYNSWLTYLNTNPTDFREMVRGFVDSIEYRMRFGQP